jgi:hypothetical protein
MPPRRFPLINPFWMPLLGVLGLRLTSWGSPSCSCSCLPVVLLLLCAVLHAAISLQVVQ